MSRVIEVIVSPQGETTVQTKGYTGGDCLQASKFLEQALGVATTTARPPSSTQTAASRAARPAVAPFAPPISGPGNAACCSRGRCMFQSSSSPRHP